MTVVAKVEGGSGVEDAKLKEQHTRSYMRAWMWPKLSGLKASNFSHQGQNLIVTTTLWPAGHNLQSRV